MPAPRGLGVAMPRRAPRAPYTKRIRPVTFDLADAAKGRDDVVLVHLNHPLVQMSLRLCVPRCGRETT
ncbi:MAG: hypothetical protein U0271_48615 [Polyangiaceae bacterium]